eukprot:4113474-Amphidinium_carterae.1
MVTQGSLSLLFQPKQDTNQQELSREASSSSKQQQQQQQQQSNNKSNGKPDPEVTLRNDS